LAASFIADAPVNLICLIFNEAIPHRGKARAVVDLPDVTTPAELAKQLGWSERHVRALARDIGTCRILGNRMSTSA
jgi:hypothetical protein